MILYTAVQALQVIKLKGSFHKKNLSPKPYILDSNGVWYSSFWSEGRKNYLNFLVTKFVPWNLEGCRRDLTGRHHRTSRDAAPRGLVLEINYRGNHGRRTEDIWEDPKTGRPKHIIGECQYMCSKL